MQEEIAAIGWLGDKTYYHGKYLESMKVILTRTPSNGGICMLTGHLMSPCEASIGGTRLHLIELLGKGVP